MNLLTRQQNKLLRSYCQELNSNTSRLTIFKEIALTVAHASYAVVEFAESAFRVRKIIRSGSVS